MGSSTSVLFGFRVNQLLMTISFLFNRLVKITAVCGVVNHEDEDEDVTDEVVWSMRTRRSCTGNVVDDYILGH